MTVLIAMMVAYLIHAVSECVVMRARKRRSRAWKKYAHEAEWAIVISLLGLSAIHALEVMGEMHGSVA